MAATDNPYDTVYVLNQTSAESGDISQLHRLGLESSDV